MAFWRCRRIDYPCTYLGCCEARVAENHHLVRNIHGQDTDATTISGLLLGTTLGTAISPWVTSEIVERSSSYFVLRFGPGCYMALVIVLLLASRGYAASQASQNLPKGAAAAASPDADSGLAS